MAFQLEFAEERVLYETIGRQLIGHRGPASEMRRAYDALIELSVGSNASTTQPLEEYSDMYLEAFQAYNRGDLLPAELLARGVKHLCRAAWFDAKIKHLEKWSEELPHVPGLNKGSVEGIEAGIHDVGSRLARLRLTGLADRFGSRARKHLEVIQAMPDMNRLLADTFMKAAYEYCLATESLHELEFRKLAA